MTDVRPGTAELAESAFDMPIRIGFPLGVTGLVESVRRHRPAAEVLALRADLDVRAERFARLRELDSVFTAARAKADTSAREVEYRANAATEAAEKADESYRAVESAVDTLRTEIREWAAGTAGIRGSGAARGARAVRRRGAARRRAAPEPPPRAR